MASCYDISAQVTLTVLMELQVDADNKADAKRLAVAHLTQYPPMVSDGAVYHVSIDSIEAKRRGKA